MKCPTFPSRTMLRALAELLRLHGHATTEVAIARGMEAITCSSSPAEAT